MENMGKHEYMESMNVKTWMIFDLEKRRVSYMLFISLSQNTPRRGLHCMRHMFYVVPLQQNEFAFDHCWKWQHLVSSWTSVPRMHFPLQFRENAVVQVYFGCWEELTLISLWKLCMQGVFYGKWVRADSCLCSQKGWCWRCFHGSAFESDVPHIVRLTVQIHRCTFKPSFNTGKWGICRAITVK